MRTAGSHLQVGMLLLLRGLSNELARNLAAGSNEAHNVGMERQLALQVHLILEQLQSSRVQPCIQPWYKTVIFSNQSSVEICTVTAWG